MLVCKHENPYLTGYTYLDLVGHVEGILEPCIGEDDPVQGCRSPVRRDVALERLGEVDARISDTRVTTKNDKASD